MKIAVTGGAGFIGKHTVEALLEQNHQVVVIDYLEDGTKSYFDERVTLYQMDIGSAKLSQIFSTERPDAVIHLAGQISVQRSLNHPYLDAQHNILGTVNVLRQCVDYHVRKIVFSSTAAVYGNPLCLPIQEDHEVDPLSFYGLSKLTSEKYIEFFSKQYGLDYTILRYANVYGPGQTVKGEGAVVASFVNRMLAGERPTIYGDGQHSRDFVFVRDVASANAAALWRGSREVMNISSGKPLTIQELFDILRDLSDLHTVPDYQAAREGDIVHSLLSNHKARTLLNWEPVHTIVDGLKMTLNEYSLHQAAAR
ncbi:NAD-dependent epimerase/dehydratase family protein [Paenibacillus zeisoli]|uniref:NAD-dependent epimerase/dehydratase family protein n=1 Tax=Paenibacillus zeisoli TaxID=2496267 RepID=A0A3S1B725_9BACL|nr:NAD-dependent epimerase/dehydratase family protein [Paenibacillus zeisoli]RUT33460.1 NAD-dependent epimerase/dehydratase family protein [Paenibacillus zeisoli]